MFCKKNRNDVKELRMQLLLLAYQSSQSKTKVLTTLPQLKGNIKTIVEISKNSNRQVINTENSVENIIKRIRPKSGSKNNPTCTVPAEHSVTKHAADDNC